MEITDNTLLYFFSTFTQSIAAIVGITSAFSIFQFQNLLNEFNEKNKKIVSFFREEQNKNITFSPEESEKFSHFVTDIERVEFAEKYFLKMIDESNLLELKKRFNQNQILINSYRSWDEEFKYLNGLKKKVFSFKRDFFQCIILGLILVILGLGGIFIADLVCVDLYRLMGVAIFFIFIVIYFVMILRMMKHVFRIPFSR